MTPQARRRCWTVSPIVFHRALDALPKFRGHSRLSTWLYRIAWREGLRNLQKRKSSTRNETPIDDAHDPADPGESALEALERWETAECVQRALSGLPVRDREILALRYMEDLKVAELAERINMPVGTVKAQIHRALARLKTLLERHHDA